MSVKLPAVAASILLAGTIGIHANSASAATARISPIVDTGTSAFGRVDVALRHNDDCRMKIGYSLLNGAATKVLFRSPVKTANACAFGASTIYEDDSVSTWFAGNLVSTANLYAGRHYIGVNIFTRERWIGAPWVQHTYVRSFWHTPASQMPTARIAF